MDETNLFISNFEIKDARRLLVKILLFVPVLLMVMAVNIILDPANLYRKTVHQYESLEYHTAQALVEGKSVRIQQRVIDDRVLQKYFIENMITAPDIIILGSSHSVWLGDNIFSNKKVINNSVLRAGLADYLGIFEAYAKKDLYPKRVIFILDPQLTVFPLISANWVSIKGDTYSMLQRLGIRSAKIKQPVIPQAWLNIFSFSYFQEAIREWSGQHRQQTHLVDGDVPGVQLFLEDGRRLWDLKFFSRDIEKSRRKTIKELEHFGYFHTLTPMKPDKELEAILESFIRYLVGHHIQVTLCLLPVHPEAYKSYLEHQGKPGFFDFVGVEQDYRGLAKRLDLEIIGSYNPDVCNLDDKDFYDGDHIRNDAIERMFKQKGSPCSMPGL